LADRLKAAGNRLVSQNFKINNPPERKLAALRNKPISRRDILPTCRSATADFPIAPSTPWSLGESMPLNDCCSLPKLS
jgi:hypothetical protein